MATLAREAPPSGRCMPMQVLGFVFGFRVWFMGYVLGFGFLVLGCPSRVWFQGLLYWESSLLGFSFSFGSSVL